MQYFDLPYLSPIPGKLGLRPCVLVKLTTNKASGDTLNDTLDSRNKITIERNGRILRKNADIHE